MRKIISAISLAIIFALSASALYAVSDNVSASSGGEFEKVGAAGAQFLKVDLGARATAMGGAYCSVADDITSIHWNPSGLASIKGVQAAFSYTQWFMEFSHNFGAVAFPVGDDFTGALHIISFGISEIPITTIDEPDGTGSKYSVGDVSFGASFSGFLTDNFSFGFTAKYLQNTFASLEANGFAFDIGTMYHSGISGIKLGFSIHNLGVDMAYSGYDLKSYKKLYDEMYQMPLEVEYIASSYTLPLIFRAGLSGDVVNDGDHRLIAAMDFTTFSDVPEQFAVGAEYSWKDFLAVRAGYRMGQDQFGLSGGIGLKYIGDGFGGSLMYSLNPTESFGLVNRIGLIVNVGE